MGKRVRGICAYCAKDKKLTADHVPPKLLLAPPYPANLLTVPACQDCNSGFQRDDEYTRTVVSLDVRAADHEDVKAKLPAILRSLAKPDARGFAEYLARQASETRILAVDGRPAGLTMDADRSRVNATGAHIVRGLHFLKMGRAIPESARVKIEAKASVTSSDPVVLQFARLYSGCSNRFDGEVGKAFSYAGAAADRFSIWLLLLYDYFFWVATVANAPDI